LIMEEQGQAVDRQVFGLDPQLRDRPVAPEFTLNTPDLGCLGTRPGQQSQLSSRPRVCYYHLPADNSGHNHGIRQTD
jgi:hypothetical protein